MIIQNAFSHISEIIFVQVEKPKTWKEFSWIKGKNSLIVSHISVKNLVVHPEHSLSCWTKEADKHNNFFLQLCEFNFGVGSEKSSLTKLNLLNSFGIRKQFKVCTYNSNFYTYLKSGTGRPCLPCPILFCLSEMSKTALWKAYDLSMLMKVVSN